MPDPAAIAGHPTSRRPNHVPTLTARLRALGATPAEVAEFSEAWITAQDDPVTAAAAEAEVADLVHLSDEGLRAMLVAVRTGYSGEAQPDEAIDQAPGAVVTNVIFSEATPGSETFTGAWSSGQGQAVGVGGEVRLTNLPPPDPTEMVNTMNVPAILAAVGDNAALAQAVLVAEDVRASHAGVYPRRTLRAGLEPLLP